MVESRCGRYTPEQQKRLNVDEEGNKVAVVARSKTVSGTMDKQTGSAGSKAKSSTMTAKKPPPPAVRPTSAAGSKAKSSAAAKVAVSPKVTITSSKTATAKKSLMN